MNTYIPVNLRDYLELPNQYETIVEEVHQIGQKTPYSCSLDQLPRVKNGVTTFNENVWAGESEVNALITVEIETSTDTWEQATIIDGEFPAALEVSFQLAQPELFPFSPKMSFHTSHKGQSVRISYTGLGSVPLAQYFRSILHQLSALGQVSNIAAISEAVYNGGLYDGEGEATTRVWFTSSGVVVVGTDRSMSTFPGMWVEFGAGGNGEISQFTSAWYWKRVLVCVDYTGSWNIVLFESEEYQNRASLVSPEIRPQYTPILYLDIKNNGTTGTPGAVNVIETEHITPVSLSYREPNPSAHELSLWGNLEAGDEIDVPWYPGRTGVVDSFVVFLADSGSSGQTRINILRCSASDETGETIFDSVGDQAVIASTGVANMAICLLINFDQDKVLFSSAHWFRFVVEEWAVGAENLSGSFYTRLQSF